MAGPAPLTPKQQNDANTLGRMLMLTRGISSTKNLGSFAAASLSSPLRIKLQNIGLITSLVAAITASVTIATATGTPSAKAPYNLIQNVNVADYMGTPRINMSGFALFVHNCWRRKALSGYQNNAVTAVNAMPVVPTAIGTNNMIFMLELPLAFDDVNVNVALRDLRGSIWSQTAAGELYVTFTWNQTALNANDDNAVYKNATGTVTIAAPTVQLFQNYILPQPVPELNGRMPFPNLDVNTVYELNGSIISTDNLVNGSEKLINYPNARQIVAGFFNFMNSAALSRSIGNLRLLYGSNSAKEYSILLKEWHQRQWFDGDMVAPGVIVEDHTTNPINTDTYGAVQYGITPNAALTNPNIEISWASFYTFGAAVPGMVQGS